MEISNGMRRKTLFYQGYYKAKIQIVKNNTAEALGEYSVGS